MTIKKIIRFLKNKKIIVTFRNFPNNHFVKLTIEDALIHYQLSEEIKHQLIDHLKENSKNHVKIKSKL